MCPVCHETDGFHNEKLHDEARNVPRELLKESGWQRNAVKRRERRHDGE